MQLTFPWPGEDVLHALNDIPGLAWKLSETLYCLPQQHTTTSLEIVLINMFKGSDVNVCILQLHLVHYNNDSYDSISAALGDIDGLAVLGILIEVLQLRGHFHKVEATSSCLNWAAIKRG